MKFIRKALLPAVVAAGFLGFLGAIGPSVSADVVNVNAGPGDVCEIEGPDLIAEGETADYTARIQGLIDAPAVIDIIFDEIIRIDDDGDLGDVVGAVFDGTTTDVNLDDSEGDSDITSVDRDGDGDTEEIPATDHLNAIETFGTDEFCGDDDDAEAELADALEDVDDFIADLIAEDIADCILEANVADVADLCVYDLDGDGPLVALGVLDATPTPAAFAALIAAEITAGEDCFDMAADLEVALVLSGVSAVEAAFRADVALELCLTGGYDVIYELLVGVFTLMADDREITVDVTCDEPGWFDLSFAPEWSIIIDLALGPDVEIDLDVELGVGEALSQEVRCGSDVDHGTITATPTTVEINPSIGNVAHSLIRVTLFDEDDDNALAGDEVMFISDRCAIESSAVDTEAEFEAAEAVFGGSAGLNALNPATAAAVESSVYATTAPDSASRQQEEVNSFVVTSSATSDFAERTVAAVILHCDPIHAPGVTPGPAVVTAYVERGDDDIDEEDIDDRNLNDDDLVLRTTVTVVGPPAANGLTVTAAPSTLACGEKATISVDVKDAIGQPVSDHTWVEAVTNAGGVLAGTGAVAGQAGLVTPISSTVAETFGGKATFYLLTSTAHVGKYEVVVTTGGGGGVSGQLLNGGVTTNLLGGLFTTPPISVQVTVECTVPAAPPIVVQQQQPNQPTGTAPNTGQGSIRPPSTGDAGMVSNESNSWVAGAMVAVFAAIVVAGFSLKVAREK